MSDRPVKFFAETLGLSPLGLRFRQARVALLGEEDVPRSKFGLSSLQHLHPTRAPKLWLGRFLIPRKAILTNLFNHRPTPIEQGWSVAKRQTEDFRGRNLTYDSHNGTDFAVPIGTDVVAPAPAVVARIASEYNRGGLKVFLDHGDGLMTCFAHLARATVRVGDRLERGQRFAISGYSGLDALVTFPFGIPHIHLNVWLDGVPVDPFCPDPARSLWRGGGLPVPAPVPRGENPEPFEPSRYDAAKVDAAITACKTASSRERLRAIAGLAERAAALLAEQNYYPTRFPRLFNVYDREYPREPRLDLPFSERDIDGVVFIDEL